MSSQLETLNLLETSFYHIGLEWERRKRRKKNPFVYLYCPKLINIFQITIDLNANANGCWDSTNHDISLCIFFGYCRLTASKLNDQTSTKWNERGTKRSLARVYKLRWDQSNRRIIEFFKFPAKFTRIIDGLTNDCTKC